MKKKLWETGTAKLFAAVILKQLNMDSMPVFAEAWSKRKKLDAIDDKVDAAKNKIDTMNTRMEVMLTKMDRIEALLTSLFVKPV